MEAHDFSRVRLHGKIYNARMLKNGNMSEKERTDVTIDAVNAVIEHIGSSADFHDKGVAGYDIPQPDGNVIKLRLFDSSIYEIVFMEAENDN